MLDFDQIFKKYHTPLFLYAHKFVDDENAALDLVQDTFTIVWEKKKITSDEEHVKAFLFASVRNAALNYLKHEKVVQKHYENKVTELGKMELFHYESGEKSLIEKESLQYIYRTIDTLPGIYKEVIELSRFEGLKNHEIAGRLNIPVRTVETRLFRALATLREKLSEKTFRILLNIWQIKSAIKKNDFF